MNIHIRQETSADHRIVEELVEAAFKNHTFSDQTEHFLVAKLRKSETAFVPELSLVAELEEEIVGHILFTKIVIESKESGQSFPSLTLAPVSVKPGFQKQGIGRQLIEYAHGIAREMGFQSAILLGHAEYYPRFGYERCSRYGIELPFDAADANCMVVELIENGLEGVNGMVVYDAAFFE